MVLIRLGNLAHSAECDAQARSVAEHLYRTVEESYYRHAGNTKKITGNLGTQHIQQNREPMGTSEETQIFDCMSVDGFAATILLLSAQ